MKGVYFGEIHSYDDLNLILAPFTPTPATPRTNFLDIPGRDGQLDLTEALGEVKYDSRNFQFTFTVAPGDDLTFDERVSVVSNALNGLRCKITLDRDPDYYWLGRCMVNKYEQDKNIGKITVKATVDPYKWKQEETVVRVTFDSTSPINTDAENPMTFDDIKELGIGRYMAYYPFTCHIDENTAMTLDDKSILIIGYGASSTERTYTCNCVQYTYDLYNNTLLSVLDVEPDVTVVLSNIHKRACPIISCPYPNAIVKFGDTVYKLNSGNNKILDIQLEPGDNVFKVTAYPLMTFRWQEGAL